MLKGLGDAASSLVLVAVILTSGALSLVQVEAQPVFQILRNVMIAALGGETRGLEIQGSPPAQSLDCDFKTGICTWK